MGRRKRYKASDETTAARGGSLGQRIIIARTMLSLAEGERVSQEVLGARLAKQLNDPQPITGATVSRWETGESVPDLETLAAIGAVCGVDPGWIAFGSASKAADPRDPGLLAGLRTYWGQGQQLWAELAPMYQRYDERAAQLREAQHAIERIASSTERDARMAELRAEFARFEAAEQARRDEVFRRFLPALTQPVDELARGA
jgi:transcriptional regulator with XRE-family HTH domain